MPIYEFKCSGGHKEELLLKISDLDDLRLFCVECKEEMAREYAMHSKPLVSDKDLITARSHSGKK